MITPLDIQNKEFSRGVRGYKEEEVDEFLDLLTVDMEKLLAENAALKEQVQTQSANLEKYRGSEDKVLETLEAAKSLMGDISASAEKRAEILLKNAQLDAELITREARENVERLTEENLTLKRRFAEFRAKYKSLLESELERFETLSTEVYSNYGIDDLQALVAAGSKAKPVDEDDLKSTRIVDIEDFENKFLDDGKKTTVNFKPIKTE